MGDKRDKRRCRYCAFRIANEIGDDVWAYRCGITNEYKGQGNDCCSSYRPDKKKVGFNADKYLTIVSSTILLIIAMMFLMMIFLT